MADRGRKAVIRRLKSFGLTEREADETARTLIENIIEGLEKEGKVMISGFGRFAVRRRPPRNSKLPGQEEKRIPSRRTIHFKASPNVFRDLT